MKYGFWERFYKVEKWSDNKWCTVGQSTATVNFERFEDAEVFVNKLMDENLKYQYQILEFTVYQIPYKRRSLI